MMRRLILGSTVAALAAAPLLAAVPGAPGAPPRGERNSRVETRADVQAGVAKMFAKLDANKDGAITEAELGAVQAQRLQKAEQKMEQRAAHFDPARMFARLDTNKDGKLTKAEVDADLAARAKAKGGPARGADRLFARLDSNKDGLITLAEMQAMPKPDFAKRKEAMMQRAKMGTHGRLFAMADLNKDGKVTLAEAQQAALQRFDQADKNRDGKVTPDERKAMRQAMRAQIKS